MIRLLLFVSLLPALAWGQPFRWTTYTSTSNVVDLVSAGGSIWSASAGGLSGYDPATGLFDVYTNTRGLAMNRSTAVGKDSRGWVWAAHTNGAISRINPATGEARVIDDLRDEVFEITAILDVGEEVFVSANNGVYRFSFSTVSDNYRVLESIRVLGQFPGETGVRDLAVAGEYLYAATALGMARSWLGNEFLSAPSAWENYTTSNGLPENSLAAVFGATDSSLWIATAGQIVRFDGNQFTIVSVTGGIQAFAEWNAAIYVTTPNNVFRIDGINLSPIGQWLPAVRDLIAFSNDDVATLVVGIGNAGARGGLAFLVGDQWSEPVSASNIASNFISTVKVDRQGRLWAGGGSDTPGVFMHDDGQWTNYFTSTEHPELFFAGATNSFAFDNSGGTWAGSEGVGVAWFHDDSISFFNTWDSSGFDVNGPRLTLTAPPPPEPGYLVARVIRNAVGDIYIYNRLFGTDRRLMRVSGSWAAQGNHPEPWMYYGSIPEAQGKDLEPMLIDAYSRVWLGGQERNGSSTFVLDEMQTPDDTTGDQWFEYVPSSLQDQITCFDNILSGVVSWDIDKQGYLWVGTHNGAYYSQAGIPADLDFLRFICVVDLPTGNSVNAVHVDAQDNKWFGTDNGVAVMDKNFTWIHVFRTADSPEHRSDLASNTITSISSDPVSGDVWIGTTDGLSRLQTPYLSRGGELGELWPYPSPFVADGTHRLFVDHRRLGGRFDDLRVYTLSGRLVRELTWTQMISPGTGWDGRNDDGELVAGGVYLLLASSTDGNSATGKVAVLGK